MWELFFLSLWPLLLARLLSHMHTHTHSPMPTLCYTHTSSTSSPTSSTHIHTHIYPYTHTYTHIPLHSLFCLFVYLFRSRAFSLSLSLSLSLPLSLSLASTHYHLILKLSCHPVLFVCFSFLPTVVCKFFPLSFYPSNLISLAVILFPHHFPPQYSECLVSPTGCAALHKWCYSTPYVMAVACPSIILHKLHWLDVIITWTQCQLLTFAHTHPHKPLTKIKVTICNHQADSSLLFVAWCLIWWLTSLKIVWSYMTPNVLYTLNDRMDACRWHIKAWSIGHRVNRSSSFLVSKHCFLQVTLPRFSSTFPSQCTLDHVQSSLRPCNKYWYFITLKLLVTTVDALGHF